MSSAYNPYSELPKTAFWRTAVATENPYAIEGIFKPKFPISENTNIATAGSCFAQHITRQLKHRNYSVLDVEPAPHDLPEEHHQKYGFSMYSARYGNIYSVRQLYQLAQEASGRAVITDHIFKEGDRYYDGLRPSIEPYGLGSAEEVMEHRSIHLKRVNKLFKSMDLFIFTLGLTEMWCSKKKGTVFPTCPGTVAGEFDPDEYVFRNPQYSAIIDDFNNFQKEVSAIRGGRPFNILLTVSPVPLTATASGTHALLATTYSKSVLRAVAGQLSTNQAHIDYFPSFEIATNPRLHSTSYSENLRNIRPQAVENVMNHFFASYNTNKIKNHKPNQESPATVYSPIQAKDDTLVQCEDQLLEAFGK